MKSTNGRIRVLRVIARLNVGGPALQVGVLEQGLDPDRFEQRIVAGSVSEGEADYVSLRAPGMPVTYLDGWGREPKPTADLQALRHLRRMIDEFRPHIVHTHTAKAGTVGRIAAISKRHAAMVHTFHGHLLHGYFSPAKTRAVIEVEKRLARRTERLIAVGSQVRDDLIAAGIGDHDQYSIVPPGIDLAPVPDRRIAREMLDLPQDVPVVAFVARLTAIKRPDRLIEVMAEVRRTHPDAIVLIVGEGDLYDDVRRQAATLGDGVRLLGWRSDVEVIYGAADLALLTSDNEGTPVSLIEASLCGLPSVSTRVGSVGEVVLDGRTGIITSNDVGDLAAAVNRLIGDREMRAAMGRAAAVHGDEKYGANCLVSNMATVYESMSPRV